MDNFFLIAPPGLENIVEFELRAWIKSLVNDPRRRHWLGPEVCAHLVSVSIKVDRGGLSLELPREIGFSLNHVLKTPSRILIRVADFGCRDFPKLFKKMRGFNWSPWIGSLAPTPEFVVSSSGSRLAIKKRIEKTVRDGFVAWKKQNTTGAVARETVVAAVSAVYVRFLDDVATISLDTSGEHLHRRGYRRDISEAPLRENFGAALVMALFKDKVQVGDMRGATLVDPMCGSGTLLLEAALLETPVHRAFAYEDFPCAKDLNCALATGGNKELEPTGRLEETAISANDFWSGLRPHDLHFNKLLGFDLSSEMVSAAHANAKRAKVGAIASFEIQDVFAEKSEPKSASKKEIPKGESLVAAFQTADSSLQPLAVVCNPPYGERLKIKGNVREYFASLMNAIEMRYRPDRAGLLLPADAKMQPHQIPAAWRIIATQPFSNGGLAVVFYVFARK